MVCELGSGGLFACRSQWGCGISLALCVSSVLATEVVLWPVSVLLCRQIWLDRVCPESCDQFRSHDIECLTYLVRIYTCLC